jgi:hypothetical protein
LPVAQHRQPAGIGDHHVRRGGARRRRAARVEDSGEAPAAERGEVWAEHSACPHLLTRLGQRPGEGEAGERGHLGARSAGSTGNGAGHGPVELLRRGSQDQHDVGLAGLGGGGCRGVEHPHALVVLAEPFGQDVPAVHVGELCGEFPDAVLR